MLDQQKSATLDVVSQQFVMVVALFLAQQLLLY